MTNKEILEKAGWNFSTILTVDVAQEHIMDAAELLDGYQAHNTTEKHNISKSNVKKLVDDVIKENILSFKKQRTIERKTVLSPLYDILEEYLDFTDVYLMDIFIVNNKDKIGPLIEKACQQYKITKQTQIKNAAPENTIFKLPLNNYYNDVQYELFTAKKYAYNKCYLSKDRSNPEKDFEVWLEANGKVEWWYKNGDYGQNNLCIAYEEQGKLRSFYPDFIFKTNDCIYIIDTKSGMTAMSAKDKAEALQKYIAGLVKDGYKIKGGIVVNRNGKLMINSADTYIYDENLSNGWIEFNL